MSDLVGVAHSGRHSHRQNRTTPVMGLNGHECSVRRLAIPRGADGMEGLGFGLGVEFAVAAGGSGKSTAARRAGLMSLQMIGLRPELF